MTHDQTKVADFVQQHGLATTPETRLLDLLSELGEVAKEALKGNTYGKQNFTQTDSWAEELGDLYFSLLCLADQTEVNLSAVLDTVLSKYEARLSETGSSSSGA